MGKLVLLRIRIRWEVVIDLLDRGQAFFGQGGRSRFAAERCLVSISQQVIISEIYLFESKTTSFSPSAFVLWAVSSSSFGLLGGALGSFGAGLGVGR